MSDDSIIFLLAVFRKEESTTIVRWTPCYLKTNETALITIWFSMCFKKRRFLPLKAPLLELKTGGSWNQFRRYYKKAPLKWTETSIEKPLFLCRFSIRNSKIIIIWQNVFQHNNVKNLSRIGCCLKTIHRPAQDKFSLFTDTYIEITFNPKWSIDRGVVLLSTYKSFPTAFARLCGI